MYMAYLGEPELCVFRAFGISLDQMNKNGRCTQPVARYLYVQVEVTTVSTGLR